MTLLNSPLRTVCRGGWGAGDPQPPPHRPCCQYRSVTAAPPSPALAVGIPSPLGSLPGRHAPPPLPSNTPYLHGPPSPARPQVSSFMGARNLKMQVQVLYALKNLCWTEHMLLRVVKEFDCMPILIQLLESNGIDVRQEAAGCLAVILQRPEQRVFFTALGGPEAALKGLKTSLAITRELDKELTALTRKRDEDQRNRQIEQDLQRQRSIASRATAATTLMGPALLTHEEVRGLRGPRRRGGWGWAVQRWPGP